MEEDLLESERAQMRRVLALQKVANGILLKWLWLLLPAFVVLSVLFSVYLVWRSAYSTHRFDAVTRLLYNPRQVAKIQNMTDKQLFSVLNRPSIKRRVGNSVPMSVSEKECLTMDLKVVQERKPSNLYTITSHAPTWVGAVRKANAYAEALIDEYVTYRKRDLENWSESIQMRRAGLQKQIAELESEESIAKGQTGVASPVEALTTLNALISDQRRNLSILSVQAANEDVKRKKLEKSVGGIGAVVVANAALIRQKSAELDALDKEISKLREVYTDLNPKVMGKLDERRALLDGYMEMLKKKGIYGVSIEDVERVEREASELAEVSLKLEVLSESHRTLEQELKENERRSAALITVIPTIERLRIKRADLDRAMRDFDTQLDDIAFLEMSMSNDLQQIERAGGAGDKNPMHIKNFALAVGGATLCTITLAAWLLFVELVFGKILGAKELGANGDMLVLGSLPKPGAMPDDEEKDVLGVVALTYCNAAIPKDTVLVCRLPGVQEQPKFRVALDWSLSMGGQRSFVLEVVSSYGFEPPAGGEPMINVVRKGSHGWFPVENRYSLAPTELQMLQADIATLRSEFDSVFIMMPGGLRRGGSFFDQLLGICSSAMVIAGVETTPRAWLSYVRKHVLAAEKPMMGIATGASAHVVRKEMDKRK